MTKQEVMTLKYGDIIYSMTYKNADGTPARYRVNGKIKTWKTRPADFRLPLKRGLYEYWALDPSNVGDFSL